MTPLLWQKVRETKEPLDKSERGKWKSWLKTQHSKKNKIMASGPITSWQIDGETMETVTTLFSWAPKSLQIVTAAMKLKDTCSLETSIEGRQSSIKANLERTKVTLNFL